MPSFLLKHIIFDGPCDAQLVAILSVVYAYAVGVYNKMVICHFVVYAYSIGVYNNMATNCASHGHMVVFLATYTYGNALISLLLFYNCALAVS